MSGGQYEYTRNMDALFDSSISELKSYFCREDFELAIDAVLHAPKDAVRFCRNDLEQLCRARGLTAAALLADRTLLEQIPTRRQLQSDLLRSFYEICKNAPSTSGYMERIVRRLAPEYATDTVRTVILKKFVLGADADFKRFDIKGFYMWAEARFNAEEKAAFRKADEQERKALAAAKLDDSVFDQKPVVLTAADVLTLIVDRIEKYRKDPAIEFDGIVLRAETREMLAGLSDTAAGPIGGVSAAGLSDTQLLRAFTDAIKTEEKPQQNDDRISAAVAAVEKDFRKQLRGIVRVSRTGGEGTVDELYRQAKKDALDAKKKAAKKDTVDLDLLELCNDLAEGNFRVNGKTKVRLYYFAFMFGMTVPLRGRACDPDRDIVKNLFEDYYHDNLLRLLSGAYTDPRSAASVETEPTGEGINYKNFAEAVYLYFLCRDDMALTPGQKIDRAEETIEKCIRLAKSIGRPGGMPAGMHTAVYRNTHFDALLNRTEEELPAYVAEHYLVIPPENGRTAHIMVASEENTASDYFDELLEDMEDVYDDDEAFGITQKNEMTEERKKDIVFKTDPGFDWKIKDLLTEAYGDDASFMKVVSELDRRVRGQSDRFDKNERRRMLTLLHVLAVSSDEDHALSVYQLQSRMGGKGVTCVEQQLSGAAAALRAVGYDIRKSGDRYCLGEREIADSERKALLRRVSDRYYRADDESDHSLSALLVKRFGVNRRITRNDLIALHLSFYVSTLGDESGFDTFPAIFNDYADSVNEYLEEARYQPLSRKNIFDMYVVMALYFYLVENNGYMSPP